MSRRVRDVESASLGAVSEYLQGMFHEKLFISCRSETCSARAPFGNRSCRSEEIKALETVNII